MVDIAKLTGSDQGRAIVWSSPNFEFKYLVTLRSWNARFLFLAAFGEETAYPCEPQYCRFAEPGDLQETVCEKITFEAALALDPEATREQLLDWGSDYAAGEAPNIAARLAAMNEPAVPDHLPAANHRLSGCRVYDPTLGTGGWPMQTSAISPGEEPGDRV